MKLLIIYLLLVIAKVLTFSWIWFWIIGIGGFLLVMILTGLIKLLKEIIEN